MHCNNCLPDRALLLELHPADAPPDKLLICRPTSRLDACTVQPPLDSRCMTILQSIRCLRINPTWAQHQHFTLDSLPDITVAVI